MKEMNVRERDLCERETSVREAERQGILGRSLQTWEASLTAREAELRVRENAYENRITTRLRAFLSEVESWGIRAPILERPETRNRFPIIIPTPGTVRQISQQAGRTRLPSDQERGTENREADANGSSSDPSNSSVSR